MTWIPDLSRDAYMISAPFVRAVGWLSHLHSYPTGPVPAEFVDRLYAVAGRASAAETAYGNDCVHGYHSCELCPADVGDGRTSRGNIGMYNFCVPFEQLLFVCPELVAHYVRDHHYRPPEEFITAVLETPLPEEPQMDWGADAKGFEPASAHDKFHQLLQAVDATDYGRIAATFRDRLETLHALDSKAASALGSRWTVKGQCARCRRWTYGYGAAGDLTCCGASVVQVETRTIDAAPPVVVVVMGDPAVARTVGQLLAERNAWVFRDADDFQSPAIVAKIRRSAALTDADCAPWLEDLRTLCVETMARGSSLVLVCPALHEVSCGIGRVPNLPGVHLVRLGLSGDQVHPFANGGHREDAIDIDSAAEPQSMLASIVEQLAMKGWGNRPPGRQPHPALPARRNFTSVMSSLTARLGVRKVSR